MEWESAEEGEIVSDSEQRNRQVNFDAYMNLNYTPLTLNASDEQLQQAGSTHESALDTPRIQRLSESDEHDFPIRVGVPFCPASVPNDPKDSVDAACSGLLVSKKPELTDSSVVPTTDGVSGAAENETESDWSDEDERPVGDEAALQEPQAEDNAQSGTADAHETAGVRESWFMVEKGRDPLELLPEGWIEVRHASGMPVYLHKPSRVCTLARPYLLGPASVRVSSLALFLFASLPHLLSNVVTKRELREKFFEQPIHLQIHVKFLLRFFHMVSMNPN